MIPSISAEQLAIAQRQLAPARDFALQPRQAREQQRCARLVQAVVEAEAGHVVGVGAPLWRSHVPLVIACERRERAKPATSSSSVHSSPPSPTERTLLEKKLNAPASPRSRVCAPRASRWGRGRRPRSGRSRASQSSFRRVGRGGVSRVVDHADRLRARRDAPLDVLGVQASARSRETISANTGVAAAVERPRRQWPRT